MSASASLAIRMQYMLSAVTSSLRETQLCLVYLRLLRSRFYFDRRCSLADIIGHLIDCVPHSPAAKRATGHSLHWIISRQFFYSTYKHAPWASFTRQTAIDRRSSRLRLDLRQITTCIRQYSLDLHDRSAPSPSLHWWVAFLVCAVLPVHACMQVFVFAGVRAYMPSHSVCSYAPIENARIHLTFLGSLHAWLHPPRDGRSASECHPTGHWAVAGLIDLSDYAVLSAGYSFAV